MLAVLTRIVLYFVNGDKTARIRKSVVEKFGLLRGLDEDIDAGTDTDTVKKTPLAEGNRVSFWRLQYLALHGQVRSSLITGCSLLSVGRHHSSATECALAFHKAVLAPMLVSTVHCCLAGGCSACPVSMQRALAVSTAASTILL